MKLITAIAALALVVGSFILVQPTFGQIQNVDEESWCVTAGFSATLSHVARNLRLHDCNSDGVNLNEYYDTIGYDGEAGELDDPPFQWVYDPETQYIRTKTKPVVRYDPWGGGTNADGDILYEFSRWDYHRCFSTNIGDNPNKPDEHPEEWNPMPWQQGYATQTRFTADWCGSAHPNVIKNPEKWLYDPDTGLLSLDAFPDWCLTMSPSPSHPENENIRYLFLAKCGDPSGYWAELEAAETNIHFPVLYPEKYSLRWEIPIAEPEEEEFGEEEEEEEFGEEAGEEPLRSRVTVPGQEEESEDDGPILNKNGKLGSKKRGKN